MSTVTQEKAPRPVPRLRRTPIIEGQEAVLIAVLVIVGVLLAVFTDTFMTSANIQTVLYTVAPIAIIGVGMTAVMVTAGIDVSVGSQMAIAMVVVGKLLRDTDLGWFPALVVAVVVGSILGIINGLLIVVGRIHPMIITFGTLNVYRYVALQIFGDQQVSGVPDDLGFIGGSVQAVTFGIPNALLLAMALMVIMWAYMRQWAGGRHLYAIGGDPGAARLTGIQVNRKLISVYVLIGVLVGIASLVQVGSGGLIQQNVGIGLELQVIAACVIGGTSVLGGRGTVFGTLLGALLVGTVSSAVTHLGWPNELTNLFVGIFIIVAVGIDLVRQKRRTKL
ncbi:ABC transporter permease [Brachybacterium sp. JHP9]|uniref:ABC transporter permease n=1 Tax=Brachybacterium equifaecis TaxID=2910770 RepID=A0ABT0R349_9MICO|nr:ABC transporter permease [Brachybacterium equifaecis]MCL6424164.1 ABC transporter permease [Brachybacterium equifaecis]